MILSKLKHAIVAHKFISACILITLAWGSVQGYRRITTQAGPTRYVLSSAATQTLTVVVSGTGQISASNQVDIKPRVSGDVIRVAVTNGQEVKEGGLIVQLDTRDAQRAVSDAEIVLESAWVDLEELLAGADAQELLQAQNALAQAQRDAEKAQKNYDTIESDAEKIISDAYNDGYTDVSTTFFNLSSYMSDLKDVLGTDESEQAHIASYENILGDNASSIQKLLEDYAQARVLYDENFEFFRGVSKNDDRDTVYKLISDTITTTEAIERALESARHMYDDIATTGYSKKLIIVSTIETMQPKIESDLSSVFGAISSLQDTKDTIDTTVADTPDNIKDAKLSLEAAKETLAERAQALADLQAGADTLDVRFQQNTVAQKEAALRTAQEDLADHSVRASFDGVVEELTVDVGDSVSSGTTLATLITRERIAEITLNEVDIAKIKVGQKASIQFDALADVALTGEVAEVDALGTTSQGVVSYGATIKFDVQDERVKPGMSVSVSLITDAKPDVLVVPSSAVQTQGNTHYVEVVDGNYSAQEMQQGVIPASSPRRQTVEIGISNDTMTEIASGLNEGDQVVTRTVTSLQTTQTTQTSGSLFTGGSRAFSGGGFR